MYEFNRTGQICACPISGRTYMSSVQTPQHHAFILNYTCWLIRINSGFNYWLRFSLGIFSRSVLGFFPVFWVRWFYLLFATFWSFDLFFAWYSQHFGVWIFHLPGLCSILALPRRQSFCGKVIRNRNRNSNQYCPILSSIAINMYL